MKMYKILANDGDVAYGIKDFICDTPEDLKDLPHCDMGCREGDSELITALKEALFAE